MILRSIAAALAMCSIAFADPVNGSFESGLTGWTASGDGAGSSTQVLMSTDITADDFGVILDAPHGLAPSDGDFFALVGNGPASTASFGVLTSDTFEVTALGGTLSFDYDFLTAEFAGIDFFPDSSGFDFFEVNLSGGDHWRRLRDA